MRSSLGILLALLVSASSFGVPKQLPRGPMSSEGELWSEEGARVLLDSHGGLRDAADFDATWPDQNISSLQVSIRDIGPTRLVLDYEIHLPVAKRTFKANAQLEYLKGDAMVEKFEGWKRTNGWISVPYMKGFEKLPADQTARLPDFGIPAVLFRDQTKDADRVVGEEKLKLGDDEKTTRHLQWKEGTPERQIDVWMTPFAKPYSIARLSVKTAGGESDTRLLWKRFYGNYRFKQNPREAKPFGEAGKKAMTTLAGVFPGGDVKKAAPPKKK